MKEDEGTHLTASLVFNVEKRSNRRKSRDEANHVSSCVSCLPLHLLFLPKQSLPETKFAVIRI